MVLNLRFVVHPRDIRKAKCFEEYKHSRFCLDEGQQSYQEGVDFCNGANDGVECKIRHECLLFALTNNEKIGVWGGTTPVTRRALRKKWPLRRGKEPRPEWKWHSEKDALKLVNGDPGNDDEEGDGTTEGEG